MTIHARIRPNRSPPAWEPLLRGEREDWIGFAIYALPELRPIGITNIRDFGNPHGTAEFGITIGDASDRGQGFGTEATRLLLDYAFTVLGVHNVWLDTPAYNAGRDPRLREGRVPRDRAAAGGADAGWNALRRGADGLYRRRVRPAGHAGPAGDATAKRAR